MEHMVEEGSSRHRVLVELGVMGGLSSATSLEAAGPHLLSALGRGLGWDVGTLWKVDRAANALRAVLVWHPPELLVPEFESATRAARFARGEGFPGRVWDTGAPVWVEDVTRDATFARAQSAAREGLHAALFFAVVTNGAVQGVVEFLNRQAHPPDAELVQALATLGRQMGKHLERTRAEWALQGVNEGLERRIVEGTQSLRASEASEALAVRRSRARSTSSGRWQPTYRRFRKRSAPRSRARSTTVSGKSSRD